MMNFINPDDPEEVQRQKLAAMLQQGAMKPIEQPQGYKVTPQVSPLQGLAQVAQGYAAGQAQSPAMPQSASGDYGPGDAPNAPQQGMSPQIMQMMMMF